MPLAVKLAVLVALFLDAVGYLESFDVKLPQATSVARLPRLQNRRMRRGVETGCSLAPTWSFLDFLGSCSDDTRTQTLSVPMQLPKVPPFSSSSVLPAIRRLSVHGPGSRASRLVFRLPRLSLPSRLPSPLPRAASMLPCEPPHPPPPPQRPSSHPPTCDRGLQRPSSLPPALHLAVHAVCCASSTPELRPRLPTHHDRHLTS